MMRGVVDSLDEDWSLVVLDDGQRLYWPRERLPQDARAGMAVALDLERGTAAAQQVEGTWVGVIGAMAQGKDERTIVRLGDQSLIWPGIHSMGVGQAVTVRMTVDEEDTERRRREVRELLDDLFAM